ncbi:unnamed protein product [Spirodela intermedia]|uniref:Uncharacterized protein n=1 Tax=Spirodela intermedia TaxID=51605 RepID=A0A7I8INJ1_SPIIN|nr:unnamed protein product [Spirodela intermedia]CAA6659446.1 unnamed protein product [Spirodela intermedia]
MTRGGGGAAELGRAGGGRWWCSYKRTTLVVCCVNLLAALYVLRSICASLYIFSASSPSLQSSLVDSGYHLFSISGAKFSDKHINRMEESIRLRRAAQPIKLIRLVQGLKKEFSRKERNLELSQPVKLELAEELLQRLKELGADTNATLQHEVLERWRTEKLGTVKMMMENATLNSTKSFQEALALKRAFESDWLMLLEDIGLWIPVEVVNKEIDDKPEDEEEPDAFLFILLLCHSLQTKKSYLAAYSTECHAEPHTDYDGTAVRWGLTHHKESAADCCQACLDHAKRANLGKLSVTYGCTALWSLDAIPPTFMSTNIRNADKPRLNFKDKYSESYRSSHPSAPEVVPWMSGVIA